MKPTLLAATATLVVSSVTASYHLSSFSTPTEAQKNLATALNGIAVAGTTAIFGLLDDDDK